MGMGGRVDRHTPAMINAIPITMAPMYRIFLRPSRSSVKTAMS
jgi:hypothetical protein